jgi:excinuclease ABC subunit C
MDLIDKLKNLPQKSGVYIFRDELGRIIYIGKANNLRNRVRQYFQNSRERNDPRRGRLCNAIKDLEYIIVNTPKEALILEANLIKRHRPFFNIRMKDDKRYPCIEITMEEEFPRIRIVRKLTNRNSRYFGPYTNSRAMRRTFKFIQKAFKIRTCSYDLNNPLKRSCLDHHINLCPAPCTGNVSNTDYLDQVRRACRFLDGKSGDLSRELSDDLQKCSENLEFEKCAVLRDLIRDIEYVSSRRPVVTSVGDDADFIGFAREENQVAVDLLQVRDGKILGKLQFIMEIPMDIDDGEVIGQFIQQHYQPGFFIPFQIFVPVLPEDEADLTDWLSEIRGKKVSIRKPVKGERKEVLDLAMINAAEHLDVERKVSRNRLEKNIKALEDLKKILSLPEIPHRIEGYDISNIGGSLATASMVVFTDGEADNSNYRHFRIKHDKGPDDFAMIRETLARRFRNLKLAELDSFREKPDVIMIDGGKGQLSAALEAAGEEGIDDIRIISLAKKEEEIFVPGCSQPLETNPDSPGMKLLRTLRDEAHRFAVRYHRKLREKNMEISILDSIPGISRKRKEILLEKFDSIDAIAEASLYELEELPGFNRKVAENVLRFLGTAR